MPASAGSSRSAKDGGIERVDRGEQGRADEIAEFHGDGGVAAIECAVSWGEAHRLEVDAARAAWS